MEKLARRWLIASAAVTSFGLAPRHATAGDLQLTVVVYDHAHLNAETLAAAERTTSAIFERASVQVVWRERLAYAAERHDVLAPEDPALWSSSSSPSRRPPGTASGRFAVGSASTPAPSYSCEGLTRRG